MPLTLYRRCPLLAAKSMTYTAQSLNSTPKIPKGFRELADKSSELQLAHEQHSVWGTNIPPPCTKIHV